jgi:hypothetical protein
LTFWRSGNARATTARPGWPANRSIIRRTVALTTCSWTPRCVPRKRARLRCDASSDAARRHEAMMVCWIFAVSACAHRGGRGHCCFRRGAAHGA